MFENTKIRKKLSLIFLVTFISFFLVDFLAHRYVQQHSTLTEATADLSRVQEKFSFLIEKDTKSLSAVLETFSYIQSFKEVFKAGDRERLYDAVLPLFSDLKDRYDITHLYFHTADGQVFLRMHDKGLYGDAVSRPTFLRAQADDEAAAGMELGKTAYALRLVMPYHDGDGRLLGYIELAKDMDVFLAQMKKEYGNDLFMLLADEDSINKEDWQRIVAPKYPGLAWETFGDHVYLGGNFEQRLYSDCATKENLEKIETEGKSIMFGVRDYQGDGRFACGGFALRDLNGKQIGFILSLHDVSSLYDTAEQLNWLLYYLLFLLSAAGFFFFHSITNLTVIKPLKQASQAAKDIAAGDFKRRIDIVRSDEVGDFSQAFNQMAAEFQVLYQQMEKRVKDKTAELEANQEAIKAKQRDLENQKRAALNILEDVAEEKSKNLAEKENLNRILQSIGDGVMAVDSERRIIIFNRVAEIISGFMAGEVFGKDYREVFRLVYERDGTTNDIIERVFKSGRIEELTDHTLLFQKSGNKLPVADSVAPIIDHAGRTSGCIMVFRDVTREREIDRQKSEFVSVASHQLRTPLTSIKWFLEMMLDGDVGKVSKEQAELLNQVSQSTERMIDLVNKLLNISRIESGRVRVDPKPTDLNQLWDNVIFELTPLVKERSLEFKAKKPSLPPINTDAKLLREVMTNLLSNAIKYTPLKGKVALAAKAGAEEIEFSISDSGIGIPAKEQGKIFHKFFRAENAVVRETEGTGMGLYVCKSVVELLGGRIWFKSVENKGTTFYFTLPLKGSIMKEGDRSLI